MAFHTWPGFDRRVGESRMADLAETLNRLVSRSARPDWTLAAIASLIAAGITASIRYAFG